MQSANTCACVIPILISHAYMYSMPFVSRLPCISTSVQPQASGTISPSDEGKLVYSYTLKVCNIEISIIYWLVRTTLARFLAATKNKLYLIAMRCCRRSTHVICSLFFIIKIQDRYTGNHPLALLYCYFVSSFLLHR